MRLTRTCVLFFACLGAAFCQIPVISDTANAGSINRAQGAAVSAGQLVAIFGSELAGSIAENDTVPLETILADSVSVTFNGITAGLDYVSGVQINAQVPWNVLAEGLTDGMATVVVTRNGIQSMPQVVNVAEFSPALFTDPPGAGFASPTGYAIAINQDAQLAWPVNQLPGLATHPAKAGDVLILYATGLGPVDSPVANGADSLDKLRHTLTKAVVLIGGVKAEVQFSGLSPNYPGVNQVNVQVPTGVTPGNAVPIQIQMNGGPLSTASAFIAVQ